MSHSLSEGGMEKSQKSFKGNAHNFFGNGKDVCEEPLHVDFGPTNIQICGVGTVREVVPSSHRKSKKGLLGPPGKEIR